MPQLRRRGVLIETEIEYRVGPYFVLAVNVKSINWIRLMKFTHRDVAIRRRKWAKQREERRGHIANDPGHENSGGSNQETRLQSFTRNCNGILHASEVEIVAWCLSWLYHLHWIISIPICWISYHTFLRSTMRRYVLTTVTDGTRQAVP